jgi:hypothetical protein
VARYKTLEQLELSEHGSGFSAAAAESGETDVGGHDGEYMLGEYESICV